MDKAIKRLLHLEGHYVKSDSTLSGYTKKELIEIIRCLEHNYGLCLYFYERTLLTNRKLARKYSLEEVDDIFREVDAKMTKAWE